MIEVKVGNTCITADDSGILKSIRSHSALWEFENGGMIETESGTVPFENAAEAEASVFENGVGKGISVCYRATADFPYAFETRTWIEASEEHVYFEWIPLASECDAVKILWPSAFRFEEKKPSWYTLLTLRQGLRIPNGWPAGLLPLPFDGMFQTAGCYMPWFGQVKDGAGYIAVSLTPWDAGVTARHEPGGSTHVQQWLGRTMGEMKERRIIRYTFRAQADETVLAGIYRSYVSECGNLVTLKEKAVRNPRTADLVGSCFVHFGIKAVVQPSSRFYDPDHPEKNFGLVTFGDRAAFIRKLADCGAEKMYLHLDGWAEPGYDNCHPDYFPACHAAGGWEGMRQLAETVHACGGMFGIHDQYRDYYLSAPSFDPDYAVMLQDGRVFDQCIWAGGEQSYLCASQALYYVRRNFERIRENGVMLDGAYLDVFTCNEADECWNPRHRMNRRACLEYRRQCFSWLTANGIMPSSEETADWAMRDLVFAHYSPYEEQMQRPGSERQGIPVPLFSLVYHDCAVIPWMMEKTPERDNMLFALLNAGAPYLVREGAYPDTDGSFAAGAASMHEAAERCRTVQELHKKCGMEPMTGFVLENEEGTKQRTEFADGTVVRADLSDGSFCIG